MRENFVAKFLDDVASYYPTELEKVKALTDEYLAKVNAVTDIAKVDKYDTEYLGIAITGNMDSIATANGKIGQIATKSEVNELAAVTSLKGVAHQYVVFLNGQITKADNKYFTNEDASGTSTYAKLDAEVEKMVGNTSARTAKEISALSDQAIALVKDLPTVAAVKAAKEAADDAVDALPTTVTLADKEKVDAAKAAAKAYKDLTATDYADKTAVDTAVTKYAYAYNNDLTAKVKAVDTKDKAAIKALRDEISAFVDTYNNKNVVNANDDTLKGYLEAIQKTEASAVRTAIAAIPVAANLTEASKGVVENARKLYDAYVAEYTDYTDYDYDHADVVTTDGFVADDFAYATLVNAETLLGLNAPTAADKVEALKITARSTAKKGSITVSWTVKGDAAAADGYRVYRSTKKNSGFGTKPLFTTTKQTYKNTKNLKKGTRYYYKVRAYKVVDGKTYFSDWSNKAIRIAK